MELEEIVKRKIIEDVVKPDKQLRLVYQMMEQEEQQKKEQQVLRRKEESWERKKAQEKKSRIKGTYNSGERGPKGRSDWEHGREKRWKMEGSEKNKWQRSLPGRGERTEKKK